MVVGETTSRAQTCYERLISDVALAYCTKFDAALKTSHPNESYDWLRGAASGLYACTARHQREFPGPIGRTVMWQRNVETGKCREVRWIPWREGEGFCYDANDVASAQPNFKPVQDPDMIACLSALGTFQRCKQTHATLFSPIVPRQTPELTLASKRYQVSACFLPSPSASPHAARPWQHEALFSGRYFRFEAPYFQEMQSMLSDARHQHGTSVASSRLAALATIFSSVGQGFVYSETKSRLLIRPNLLALWMDVACKRGYTEARIAMHGKRSGSYADYESDPVVHSMEFCRGGLQGFGLYVSLSDLVASVYNALNDQSPDGTAVIGLHLIKPSASGSSYTDYHLAIGAERVGCTSNPRDLNCSCIRDQYTWLPLGVVYPEE